MGCNAKVIGNDGESPYREVASRRPELIEHGVALGSSRLNLVRAVVDDHSVGVRGTHGLSLSRPSLEVTSGVAEDLAAALLSGRIDLIRRSHSVRCSNLRAME